MHNFLCLAWQLPTPLLLLLLLLMSFSSFFSYPKIFWCTKSVRCKIGWSGWSSVYGGIFLLWSLTIFGLEFVKKQIKVKDHHQMATILHVHMNICSNWTRNMPHATSWWHLAPNIKHKLFQLRYIFFGVFYAFFRSFVGTLISFALTPTRAHMLSHDWFFGDCFLLLSLLIVK